MIALRAEAEMPCIVGMGKLMGWGGGVLEGAGGG